MPAIAEMGTTHVVGFTKHISDAMALLIEASVVSSWEFQTLLGWSTSDGNAKVDPRGANKPKRRRSAEVDGQAEPICLR